MLNDTVMKNNRASLGLQWLRIRASTAGDTSLIPDWGSSPCFAKKQNKTEKREQKANNKGRLLKGLIPNGTI